MHKLILNFLLFGIIVSCTPLNAQGKKEAKLPDLIPYRDGELWGYCNPEGVVMIKPRYKSAQFFHGNTAQVSMNTKRTWDNIGLINKKGEEIIAPECTSIDTLSAPGYYLVHYNYPEGNRERSPRDGKTALIDKKGIETFIPGFSNLKRLNRKLFSATMNESGRDYPYAAYALLGPDMKALSTTRYYSIGHFKNGYAGVYTAPEQDNDNRGRAERKGKYGYIDSNGREVIPANFHYLGTMTAGKCFIFQREDRRMGVMDITGKSTLLPAFDSIYEFSEERAIVEVRDKVNPRKKHFGFIDPHGKNITQVIYQLAHPFKNGMAWVVRNDKAGFIDKTGKEIIPPVYDEASDFRFGAAVVRSGTMWNIIDAGGKKLVPLSYVWARFESEDIISISIKEGTLYKWGFYKARQHVFVPPIYDYIISYFKNGLASISIDKKYGVIDTMGKVILTPQYKWANLEDTLPFGIVNLDEKQGVVNRKGEIIVPLKYVNIRITEFGFPRVLTKELERRKLEYSFINGAGKEILFPAGTEGGSEFIDGLCSVWKDGKCGYIDTNGVIVIPIIFDHCDFFHGGFAKVGKKIISSSTEEDDKMKYALIDRKGKLLTSYEYDEIHEEIDMDNGLVEVEVNGKEGYISTAGVEYFRH